MISWEGRQSRAALPLYIDSFGGLIACSGSWLPCAFSRNINFSGLTPAKSCVLFCGA